METTVFLVRHGTTDWHQARKLLGRRDVGLNADGILQSEGVARALRAQGVLEVISSPLLRAVQTSEVIAGVADLQVARDPRLTDLHAGAWEGKTFEELGALPSYASFLEDPLAHPPPGGEDLRQARDRAVSAIEQCVEDIPAGESIALVSHSAILRVILAHYLGMGIGLFPRMHVAPGSISVLAFADGRVAPRVRAVNWRPALREVLG